METGDDIARASGQFTAALRHDPTFLPAIFALADLYLSGASKGNATKLLENSFTLVPHVEIADRLLALWDDNDGNSIARLIKLIPKKPEPLQRAAYHIVSDIAATKGLDGEAKRLHCMMTVLRPLAGNVVFGRAAMSLAQSLPFVRTVCRAQVATEKVTPFSE